MQLNMPLKKLNANTFLLSFICFLFSTISNAQDIVTKPMRATFQNRWTSEYLEFGNATPMLSSTSYGPWEVKPVPNMPGYIFIKVANNELYLNTEKGLGLSAIQPGWNSAMWKLEKVQGTNYYRLINLWKNNPLNNETKKLEVTPAAAGFFSAMWTINFSDVQVSAPVQNAPAPVAKKLFTLDKAWFVVQKADDGSTDPAIFGWINLRLIKKGVVVDTWKLFERSEAAGSRVIAPENLLIDLPLSNKNFYIPKDELNDYSLQLETDLYDYDAGSANDPLGKETEKISLAQIGTTPYELFVKLLGEGMVKVAVKIFSGTKSAEISTNGANWMSSVKDDVSLASLSIPGTHDTGADYGCPAMGSYALCQNLSISDQLSKGIRFLDIRCRRYGEAFTIHHGLCYQNKNFDDVLTACSQFLQSNPSETIIMNIQEEYNATDGAKPFSTIFSTYRNKYPIFYTNSYIPNMGTARGKIVLIVNTGGLNIGIKQDDSWNCDVENTYHLTNTSNKWPIVQKHIEKASIATDKKFYLTYCSANGVSDDVGDQIASFFGAVPTPEDFSKRVLPLLASYLELYPTACYGIVIMDFPNDNVIRRIISSNDSKVVK